MSIPLNVRHLSECFIRPKFKVADETQPRYLTPWDLRILSLNYIQKGLLFTNPPATSEDEEQIKKEAILERLKTSLSLALDQFYPLAGQLETKVDEDKHACWIFVDCNKGPGAKFTHTALDITVSDILSTADVPQLVHSLFNNEAVTNHDGHTSPLLSIQVTDLVDGVFIGCSMNHVVADGVSFWHFINMWSEIYRANGNKISISRPPIHKRWFPDGYDPIIRLPYIHPSQFITKYETPQLREKFFHFSSKSVAKLKEKVNAECSSNKISSFQALAALVWKSITRARCLSHDQQTVCALVVNDRQRLNPLLSQNCFGNYIGAAFVPIQARDLLNRSLGSAAVLLNQAVEDYTDKKIRDFLDTYIQSPYVYQFTPTDLAHSVTLSSSPKFNMYGNEFGLGNPLAIRSGRSGKRDGLAISYPGYEGSGSVDLEICLEPDFMAALELDEEFMASVS